ncbi:MAG: type I methionyl aminopeptidase [Bacteroidetes bacterium]|nr:type I methionyl aminopeptidase [Bacteroidota bacterium]
MVTFKTEEDLEYIRLSSLLVGKTLAEVAKHLQPGVKTIALDKIAESFIRDHGGLPGFKGYRGYPATLCISVNDEVVHGIPGNRMINDGDLVSIDCGVLMNGFYGDSAYSFAVGSVKEPVLRLMQITKESLYKGIAKALAGNKVGDIGAEIQQFVESYGYSVVRVLVGHGLGRNLHEEPEVPNFGHKGEGMMLREGMVICIEPMINLGKKGVVQDADGWTIRTKDRLPSAHYEHAIAIRRNKPEVLSSFEEIENVIHN